MRTHDCALASSLALLAVLPWPLPAAAAIAPQRLVEVADLSGLTVSPDGGRLAFRLERASVARDTYESTWYVQDMDGRSPPQPVGDGGVPLRDAAGGALPAEARWSQDGRWLFYRALVADRIEVWRAAADGVGAAPVTADAANVRAFGLSADGATLRYSVGATRADIVRAEQAEYDHGVHATPDVPIGQGVFRSHEIAGRLAMQRYTGIGYVRDGLLASEPDRWKQVNLATGEVVELGSDAATATGTTDPLLDPETGRRVAIVPAEGAGRASDSGLKVLPAPSGGQEIVCRASACSHAAITSAQWRPGTGEVLFTITPREAGGAQSVFRWNIDTGEVSPVAESRGLVNGGRDTASRCAISAEALACVVAEPDRPPRLERIDIETGRRQVMFEPNAALAADLEKSIRWRFLRWKDAEGREFTGQLLLGETDVPGRRRPLFVTYYACPGFLRGGTGDEWPLASLAADGIAALCINARPYRYDPVARYNEGLEAVRSVIALLAGEGLVDITRVGMGGLSFGSEVTQWVATESDLLAAASETAPSITPLSYLISSLQGGRYFTTLYAAWQLRAPEATPEQWKRISPAFNYDRIRIPILYQMPDEEYLFALDYLVPMIRKRTADLYIFPNETHQKYQPRHKAAACERNLDWFRFWLQDYESGDPEKRGQYDYWREMRSAMRGQGAH